MCSPRLTLALKKTTTTHQPSPSPFTSISSRHYKTHTALAERIAAGRSKGQNYRQIEEQLFREVTPSFAEEERERLRLLVEEVGRSRSIENNNAAAGGGGGKRKVAAAAPPKRKKGG